MTVIPMPERDDDDIVSLYERTVETERQRLRREDADDS